MHRGQKKVRFSVGYNKLTPEEYPSGVNSFLTAAGGIVAVHLAACVAFQSRQELLNPIRGVVFLEQGGDGSLGGFFVAGALFQLPVLAEAEYLAADNAEDLQAAIQGLEPHFLDAE